MYLIHTQHVRDVKCFFYRPRHSPGGTPGPAGIQRSRYGVVSSERPRNGYGISLHEVLLVAPYGTADALPTRPESRE